MSVSGIKEKFESDLDKDVLLGIRTALRAGFTNPKAINYLMRL